MSDGKDFESTKELLVKINDIVSKMDPVVRVATFDLLISRYLAPSAPARQPAKSTGGNGDESAAAPAANTEEMGTFLNTLDTKKPNDAVEALVAWLYSQHGAYPITAKDLKDLAGASGLIIPNRPDNTMRNAKSGGKGLFVQQGKGWKLTVSGELYMKETFNVTKGNQPIAKE